MTPEGRLEELRARFQLGKGTATLVLVVVENEGGLDETKRLLIEILRATPLTVADLGSSGIDNGPARWAELSRSHGADASVLMFSPTTPLSSSAFGRVLNAERELLRQLPGPTLLLVSRATEKALRQVAPDFFTWVAQSYELLEPRELAAIAAKLGVSPESVEPKRPPEEPIRFLHISDLHLRPQRVKRYDQDRVLGGLIEFLERDRECFPLDLIFVTGDLAQSGKSEEYALVVELLEKLMLVTGLPKDRVFVVPGNHDVDRDVSRWLLRTLSKDEDAVAFFDEPKNRSFHEQKLASYGQSMRALLGESRPLGLAVGGDAVEFVEIRGARIAVASLNSAWFAHGDDDNGKLWLGEPSVERALDRVADEEAVFAIALLHHPFEELNEIERDVIQRWVEKGFDLVLRGHLHSSKPRALAGRQGGFVEVAGPAAYQGSPWPNGCFLGEILVRRRAVRLRPYTYTSGPDPWVLDTKIFPDDEQSGYCRTFIIPKKRRLKSVATRPLRKAVEAAVRKASPLEQRHIASQIGSAERGLLQSEATEKTVATTRTIAEIPELWLGILSKEDAGHVLAQAIVTIAEETTPHRTRTLLKDAQTFEEVLREAGRMLLDAASKLGAQFHLSEQSVNIGLATAIGLLVDAPFMVEPRITDGMRPDIVIGPADAQGGALIETKRSRRPYRPYLITGGLMQLDRYLSVMHVTYAALVFFDVLTADVAGPQVTHEKTPSGRNVLFMRL